MDEEKPQTPATPPVVGLGNALLVEDSKEETELDKIIKMILDPANIAHNTELSRNEITAFSVLSTLARKHNLPVLEEFLKNNLILRVSKGRKGRAELIRILNRQLTAQEQITPGMGGPERRRWGFRR